MRKERENKNWRILKTIGCIMLRSADYAENTGVKHSVYLKIIQSTQI
jgi:hypothetical protein